MPYDAQAALETWEASAADALAVLRRLDGEDWERPSDLPGWRVREILAHLVHLEEASLIAADGPPATPPPGGGHRPMPPEITEEGVRDRVDTPPQELLAALEAACAQRRERLRAADLSDPKAPAPGLVASLGWDVQTLLRNRPVDFWMHEQDVRRATGRAMTTDGVGAAHTAAVMAFAFPYVMRAVLRPGESVVLRVSGPQARELRAGDEGAESGDEGAESGDLPAVVVELTDADWLMLAGGRRAPEAVPARLHGDEALGRRVLAALAVTP